MATRTCDNAACGAEFTTGYLVGSALTYCSSSCAVDDLGAGVFQEALENDDAFWTDWDSLDD